jgi:hypothetical protein
MDSDEVFVVDNYSIDNTVEICTSHPLVKLIRLERNMGFTVANNLAIRKSKNPFVVLLNADVFVEHDWIEKLQSHFTDGIGAVGPKSNFAANEQSLTYLQRLYGADSTVRHRKTRLLLNFCAMYRRVIFDKVGYLDENLFLGNDDLDFSLRIREAGFELVIALDTYVHHLGHHTFSSVPKPELDRMFQESTDILYEKLLPRYANATGFSLWGIDWFNPTKLKR